MAKKCPPGVICVQNGIIIGLFVSLAILIALFAYRSSMMSSLVQQKDIVMSNTSDIMSQQMRTPAQGLFPRPSYSFSNVANDVLMNPYSAPLRDDRYITGSGDVRGGVPINISTRAVDTSYRQVGILTRQNGDEMILPLMGRPLFVNRDKWQFYTMTNNNIKLPIVHKNKSCTNEYGCDNLYNGDTVYVEGFKDAFVVTAYDNNVMQYLPFV